VHPTLPTRAIVYLLVVRQYRLALMHAKPSSSWMLWMQSVFQIFSWFFFCSPLGADVLPSFTLAMTMVVQKPLLVALAIVLSLGQRLWTSP
jgi:hypothetical protein